MAVVFLLMALLPGGFGVLLFMVAESAIHEIAGAVFLVCACVLLAASGIIDAVNRSASRLASSLEKTIGGPKKVVNSDLILEDGTVACTNCGRTTLASKRRCSSCGADLPHMA